MNLVVDMINAAFTAYYVLIFVRIILSWIKHNPYQPIFRFIYEITEPYLRIFRRIIPTIGVIDISPIVALFALQFIKMMVFGLLNAIL